MTETWSPEKRAAAAQWLIEKRLTALRQRMPPEVFQAFAMAFETLMAPIEHAAK